jgi:hypothetical protein
MGTTPKLPPNEGWWLARSSRVHPHLSAVEYLRPLSDGEVDALSAAYEHFVRGREQPEVKQLFEAYQAWRGAPRAAASLTSTGPLPMEIVEKALVTFLLVWRMTLDHLARAISSRFGKESRQFEAYTASRRRAYDTYFGYRVVESMRNLVQHQEKPPLEQTLERHAYTCKKCGQEHDDVRDLSVTLSPAWLRKGCSATLKRELDELNTDSIDMRVAVEESMRGFENILHAVLLSTHDGPAHRAALVNVFEETSPDYPVLVECWSDEEGEPRVSVCSFDAVDWVVKRASMQLP